MRGEDQKTLEVLGEILHLNLAARPYQPGVSNQFAVHRGDLMAETIFHLCLNVRVASVGGVLFSGQRLVSKPLPVNLGSQPYGLEVGFGLCGIVGRVCPVGTDIPSCFRARPSLSAAA